MTPFSAVADSLTDSCHSQHIKDLILSSKLYLKSPASSLDAAVSDARLENWVIAYLQGLCLPNTVSPDDLVLLLFSMKNILRTQTI